VITNIGNILVGADQSMKDVFWFLRERRQLMAWVVATGISQELTLDAMTVHNFPLADILICSVGTEIY